MSKITCIIIIEDEESKVEIRRNWTYLEEGQAGLAWCLGAEIGSAICAIESNVPNPKEIIAAINTVWEEEN